MRKPLSTAAWTIATMLFATSCCNDFTYGDEPTTPDPTTGRVEVTADFSRRSADASVPALYIIKVGDHQWELTGEKNLLGANYAPATYTLLAYNQPKGIAIDGTVATVNAIDDEHIEPTPGYLFACYQDVSVTAGDTTSVTAQMVQQNRLLTIELSLDGGNAERISSMAGVLSGVKRSVDLSSTASGSRADNGSAKVRSAFTSKDGKMIATFILFGVSDQDAKTLDLHLEYTNDTEEDISVDMTPALEKFNDFSVDHSGETPKEDDEVPSFEISGDLTLSTELGVAATITNWAYGWTYEGEILNPKK